jgi:hypothetical protein
MTPMQATRINTDKKISGNPRLEIRFISVPKKNGTPRSQDRRRWLFNEVAENC